MMVVICDTEKDGLTPAQQKRIADQQSGKMSPVDEMLSAQSTFNLGEIDMLYADFGSCFKEVEGTVTEIS